MASFAASTFDDSSVYAYAEYSNLADILMNQSNSLGRPFPDRVVNEEDTTELMTYAANNFTFKRTCTVTVSYSIVATSIVAAAVMVTTVQLNGDTINVGLASGPYTRTGSTTSMMFSGSFTLRVVAGNKLIFLPEIKGGTPGVNGATLLAGDARASFLFRDIER